MNAVPEQTQPAREFKQFKDAEPLWPAFEEWLTSKSEVQTHGPTSALWDAFKAGAEAQKKRVTEIFCRTVRSENG